MNTLELLIRGDDFLRECSVGDTVSVTASAQVAAIEAEIVDVTRMGDPNPPQTLLGETKVTLILRNVKVSS